MKVLAAQSCLTRTPWTITRQSPLSMGFSRQEYWDVLPFPSPEDLPNPGIEPGSPTSQANSWPSELPEKPKGMALLSSNDSWESSFVILYRSSGDPSAQAGSGPLLWCITVGVRPQAFSRIRKVQSGSRWADGRWEGRRRACPPPRGYQMSRASLWGWNLMFFLLVSHWPA